MKLEAIVRLHEASGRILTALIHSNSLPELSKVCAIADRDLDAAPLVSLLSWRLRRIVQNRAVSRGNAFDFPELNVDTRVLKPTGGHAAPRCGLKDERLLAPARSERPSAPMASSLGSPPNF